MAKPKYKLLEEFKESLEDRSSENIFPFIGQLVSQGQTIRDLCERTQGAKSEKISRFQSIKRAITSYFISVVERNDFVTADKWKEHISTDFIGDRIYYHSLFKTFEWLISLKGTPKTPVKTFYQFLVDRLTPSERQPFQEAVLESLGTERWIETEAEAVANVDSDRMRQELIFIKKNSLVESFLCYLVKSIEENSLGMRRAKQFNQIIELMIDQPDLKRSLEPFLILFYSHGSFNGTGSAGVKTSIEMNILGDRKELLKKEIARFEEDQQNLRMALRDIRDKFENKKWEYISQQELDKAYSKQLKHFENKTIRFYEKWRDEEIAKVLNKLLEVYLVINEFFQDLAQEVGKEAKENSLIEKAGFIKDSIADVFQAYNAEVIGRVGDSVRYNKLTYETHVENLQKGANVNILRPGLSMLDDEGNLKYIIKKALVA